MATVEATLQAPVGLTPVTLTSWAGDVAFSITPAAGMQMLAPSALTLNADGTITGDDGTYSISLIDPDGSGTAYTESYVIGTVDETAPILSSPTATVTGATTADASVSTDEANGTLFYLTTANASETAADVISLGESQAVSATGEQNVSVTGLTADTAYYTHFVHQDDAGNDSDVATSAEFTTDAATVPADITVTGVLQAPAGWQIITLPAGYNNTLFTQQGTAFEFEATDKTGWQFGIEADPAEVELTLSGTDIVLTIFGVDDGSGNLVRPAGIDLLSSVLIDPATSGTAHGIQIDTTAIELYVEIDTTPDAFTLTDVTGQALNDQVESNAITVTGVDAGEDIPVTISGGEYAVDTGSGFGGWTSASTNVQLNYQVKVRVTTSASNSTAVSATLTIGGVSDTFTATTLAASGATSGLPETTLTQGGSPIISTTVTRTVTIVGGAVVFAGSVSTNGSGVLPALDLSATTVQAGDELIDLIEFTGTAPYLSAVRFNVLAEDIGV